MQWLTGFDWESVFVPSTPLLETVIRGSVMYLALFTLLRVILKRQWGGLGVADILVVVLIADAAQNAMADDYRSIPDGVVLVAVIVFWAWALDWASFRFPFVERMVKPGKLPLVEDGRLLHRNMRRELVTLDELESQLRLHGVDDVASVGAAYMESDGRISVITRDGQRHQPAGSADRRLT